MCTLRKIKLLGILAISIVTSSCGTTAHHPIVGKWQFVSGEGTFPLKWNIELQPQAVCVLVDAPNGNCRYVLNEDRDRLRLEFNFPGAQSQMNVDWAGDWMRLTNERGERFEYRRTSHCWTGMGTPCVEDS